jgi:hypothetical protein
VLRDGRRQRLLAFGARDDQCRASWFASNARTGAAWPMDPTAIMW